MDTDKDLIQSGAAVPIPELSHAALLLKFKDACARLGMLQHKQFLANLYGQTMTIPPQLQAEVTDLGAEVFKRMASYMTTKPWSVL